MRNQIAMAPQTLAQGQQRLQGVPTQFEPRFMERELAPPSEMVSSEVRQMHMGGHLGPPMPPHPGIPGRGFPGASYSFMPSEPMETVARRQELIHKQNIARYGLTLTCSCMLQGMSKYTSWTIGLWKS